MLKASKIIFFMIIKENIIMQNLKNFLVDEEEGQGLVEYGLIIVGIALALVLVLPRIGGKLKTMFQHVSSNLDVPTP